MASGDGKNTTKRKTPSNFPWNVVGVIFLLLLFVGLPLALTVWSIGEPVKE